MSPDRSRAFFILAVSACLGSCAGPLVRPATSPTKPASDALLVLPGFGYSRAGEQALRRLAPAMAREGIDLFVPAYLSRGGLADSRAKLQRFIGGHRLDRYERLHVFAFIAGAWTLNPLVEARGLPNLASVVYDRSPLQERAPRIALENMRFLTWVRYGSPVFDVARTPYTPLMAPNVRVGLMVETKPTSFIKDREAAARRDGPLRFDCESFAERYDDCIFLPLNHDELYARFQEVWPDLLQFLRSGRFGPTAERRPPTGDPFAAGRLDYAR